ncbi:hypothetical protein HY625_02575 [Candidatus Uhrbacteria bacterium]|nr:hypothetical protein [Candidatus Uhrbacteria bacterium]
MDHVVGFSSGVFGEEMRMKQALQFLRGLGHRTVEVGCVRMKRFLEGQMLEVTTDDLVGFESVSMHAPAFAYSTDDTSKEIIRQMQRIHALRPVDVVVVHPDLVTDFSLLVASGLPIGVENQDNRKTGYKLPEDFNALFERYPKFSFVLDLNHAFTNDQSMKLAQEFYERWGNRLVEIQVSGYREAHSPLFETGQKEIVEAVRGNARIIIESLIHSKDTTREFLYVTENL